MPSYDYDCPACGGFTLERPMAQYDRPQPCPGCGRSSERALFSAPMMALMDGAGRTAAAVNERSANAPRRAHPSGCGCCKPRGLRADRPAAQRRPWMMGH